MTHRREKIADIERRIDRLVRRPFQVQSGLHRLTGPVLRLVGWQPRIKTTRLRQLLDRITEEASGTVTAALPDRLLEAAVEELDDNVARVEHAVVVLGRAPDGHARWLWRLYQLVYRAMEWAEHPSERVALADHLADDAERALAPLRVRGRRGAGDSAREVDTIIDAALADTRSLGRQRRLLESARQLLLETAAAVPLDADAAQARRRLISRRIARLDRLQAAGVLPDVDLAYQARVALERGDVPRTTAALTALEESARAAGDWPLQRLASAALSKLWGGRDRTLPSTRQESLQDSQREVLGPEICAAVEQAYVGAEGQVSRLKRNHPEEYTEHLFREAQRYMTDRPAEATLAAALAIDGCFEVGAAASPVRAQVGGTQPRVVRHPTQDLELGRARTVDELPHALIGDPRALVPDLAAGRLLVRRYVDQEPQPTGARLVKSEVRVYVLDGSGSMIGPRARMRDALLLAELATVAKRLEDPDREWSPVLYYRYFTDQVGSTTRVATREEAMAAIADVVATLRVGGTNIQKALMATFDQIREARAADPTLGAAQIVLVTDGEVGIDEDMLERAQEGNDFPVGVSIIALGTENPVLRRLAARQRAQGARVFYHFMSDYELAEIVDGRTAGLPIHLPPRLSGEELGAEVRSLVGEIERHARGLDAAAIQQAQQLPTALAEVGLGARSLGEGERARLALLENDRAALSRAFLRLFPAAGTAAGAPAAGDPASDGDDDGDDGDDDGPLDDVVAALGSVAEVVDGFGAGALERQADAIELVERLLTEASIAPWEYDALVKRPPPRLAQALRAVHQACRFAPEGAPGR